MSNGKVRSHSRFNQPLLFEGINYQEISPTDVDAFLDFRNKLFIFAEVKYGDKQIDTGQRIAIERLVDSSHQPPARKSVAFHCRHDVASGPVYLKESTVIGCYYAGKWRPANVNFLDAVDAMVRKHVPDLHFNRQPDERNTEPKTDIDWDKCPF